MILDFDFDPIFDIRGPDNHENDTHDEKLANLVGAILDFDFDPIFDIKSPDNHENDTRDEKLANLVDAILDFIYSFNSNKSNILVK